MAWDSAVKAAWLLNNNLNDDTGNGNTPEVYGGGSGTFSSVVKYEGTHSLFVNNTYSDSINTGRGPTAPPASALTQAISANAVGFWAEAWVYDLGSGSRDMFGVEGLQGPVIRLLTDGVNAQCVWNNVGINIGNYNYNTEKQTWIHWAYTYNRATDTLKIYKSGSLIYTRTSAGDYVAGDRALLFGTSWNQPFYGYFDRVVIGIGTIPTSFPTPSITPPTVTNCTPASGPTAGGTSVTLTGTGFVAGAGVTFGGTAATGVTVVSATSITCTTPAHAAGLVDIVVTNTDTGAGTLTNGFEYIAPPDITSIDPVTGPNTGGV